MVTKSRIRSPLRSRDATSPLGVFYVHPSDQSDLLDFLVACRSTGNPQDFPSPIVLRELLALPVVRNATRLWRSSDGALAAFALVDPYQNLVFAILPGITSSDLEDEIAAWGVASLRATTSVNEPAPTLDCSCRGDDRRRIDMLVRNGFIRQEVQSIHLERDLSLPIPPQPLPPGFLIRPSAGEAEVDPWVALHRAAFGTETMTADMRLAMFVEPLYQPDLDLVCTAPDGRLAGYCCCGFLSAADDSPQCRRAFTDPVAVHPDFQRLGLSRSLLARGLELLHVRGAEVVEMGTSSENPAMLASASALGYTITLKRLWFARPLEDESDERYASSS